MSLTDREKSIAYAAVVNCLNSSLDEAQAAALRRLVGKYGHDVIWPFAAQLVDALESDGNIEARIEASKRMMKDVYNMVELDFPLEWLIN